LVIFYQSRIYLSHGIFSQNWYGIKWVKVLLINPTNPEGGRQTGGQSANYYIRWQFLEKQSLDEKYDI
jgi:hypothetical protein